MADAFGRATLVATLLVGFLVLATVPGAVAAESRAGGTVVVEEGETANGLQVVAGTVVVRGTVEGDLEGIAGTVVVRGTVTGDVEVTGGSVRIAGTVHGNVEAATGSLTVPAGGTVEGDLSVAAGDVHIAGTVGGTVRSASESTTVARTARVGGDLRYSGDLSMADGATVEGSVVHDEGLAVATGAFGLSPLSVPPWVITVYGALVNFVVGGFVLLASPAFAANAADRVAASPARTAGAGLLFLVGVPVALVLVALTLVGIPLAIVGALLYAAWLWFGYVLGSFAAGSWLLSLADVDHPWVALVVGIVAVALVARVPVAGGVVELAVLLLGVGTLSVAAVRRARGSRAEGSAVEG